MDTIKRHARLADGRLVWVGDPSDWALMRREPRPILQCPQRSCSQRLHAVLNDHGTRFLRRSGSGGGCGHWGVRTSATAPESAKHLWLKARLASICLQLGWAAVPEDPRTRADVWLPDLGYALEVQLRPTSLTKRTQARLQAGAKAVVWFVAPEVSAKRQFYQVPAVRFDVVQPAQWELAVRPWEVDTSAHLVVFGALWRWQDWRLVPARMSGFSFLSRVLDGSMTWHPRGTPGIPLGRSGWVSETDFAAACV